jgi:hypothetical protein
MALSDPDEALARFDFRSGPLRGSSLLLHAGCLIHRGNGLLETLPLPAIGTVRVSFERNLRNLRWAAGLLVGALVLFALSSPLARLASDAAGEMALHLKGDLGAGEGIAGVLHGTFSFLEAFANLLPGLASALVLGAVAFAALGWLGETRLTIGLGGLERRYGVRGRDPRLLEFAEALSERAVECALPGSR